MWKLGEERRVLYRLEAVLEEMKEGRTIYIEEGEKEVETLVSWRLDAKCNKDEDGKGKRQEENREELGDDNIDNN